MASKMLLIITYSSIVFWLILSVTCKHIFFHKCDVFNSTTSISQSLSHCNSSCFLVCSVSPSQDTTAVWDKDFSDSLSRLHKEGCPVSPSGPAEDTNAWMTMITWMNANHFFHRFLPRERNCSHTFILCSALSNPISMLMMSKPDADLFFWWTPRKSAQRVWGERQRSTGIAKRVNNVKCSAWTQKCCVLGISSPRIHESDKPY